MRRGACAGQMALDLFPAPPSDHVEKTLRWMCDVHGCERERIAVFVRRLYRDFPQCEAFSRCKALVHFFDGRKSSEPLQCTSPAQIGVFDPRLDYHTVWDRCWARMRGLPMEQVYRLKSWDYGHDRPGSFMDERRTA